jgi:hypothetical protein
MSPTFSPKNGKKSILSPENITPRTEYNNK